MRTPAVDYLLQIDRTLVELASDLRWTPLTAMFVLASAWWVKGPLFIAVAFLRDVRRARPPVTAIAVTAAVGLASLLSGLLKEAFDRDRPPVADPGFEAAVGVPLSPSFPSGHASTAFAAAAALAIFCPRLRVPALLLALAVGLSRVYLGVHYGLDVVAGAALGVASAVAVTLAVRSLAARSAAASA